MTDYPAFLASKRRIWLGEGLAREDSELPSRLYPFQRKLTAWALRKGRAAIWADTGLGKTLMQLAWASEIPGRVLILAPLCVAHQTAAEGATKLGLRVGVHTESGERIEVTNYDRLHRIEPTDYAGVVLDESSILKALDGKTRTKLIRMFRHTRYRLCCTATPAPNDITELANHAEFLGICTRAEMLATWFVHDDQGWRLRGHAREAFYRWLASWGMFVRRPSDLGFDDGAFALPPLAVIPQIVAHDGPPGDALFPEFGLGGIRGRVAARRHSVPARVARALELLAGAEPWIAWCGLNAEQDQVRVGLDGDAVSVAGADDEATKEARLLAFLRCDARVLVTKARIAGFGLNLQHCARMAFVGLSDSFEGYYQAVRRCWRYGQTRPVEAHLIVSEAERAVFENVARKAREHEAMAEALVSAMSDAEREELDAVPSQVSAEPPTVEHGEAWTMHRGDCVEILADQPGASVDFSVYSPPFIALYTYTASERDIGNARDAEEFLEHMGYVVRQLLRVTKLGRNTAVHCADVALTKAAHGVIGLRDLPGDLIRLYTAAGWIYHGRVTIQKNPQAQAVRTHSKALLFAQLRKDASWLRPGLADYLLVFRAPGENAVPIRPDVTNDQWIEWAHPVWHGIVESNTLNALEARGHDDDRHICPLQLGVIERAIRLWSNPGELVLDPFAGIGSTLYEAVRLGRLGLGVELKAEYFAAAVKNLKTVERQILAQLRLDGIS